MALARRLGLRASLLACTALGLSACADPPAYVDADYLYFHDRPRELIQRYKPAEADAESNALVGIDKMLSAAILEGDWTEAERLAELASSRVNIFLAGEKGERDALSLLGREKDKPFKGEPYERAMVDFYLGLLRFRRGDAEGALNAFLSAMAKDRGIFKIPVEKAKARKDSPNAETVLYSDDYATFAFFAAKCFQLIDEPEESMRQLEKAKGIRPDLAGLFDSGMDPGTNVFAVIEAGYAPVKVKTGQKGEILSYRRGREATVEEVRLGGARLGLGMSEDLFVQASTMGGRAVDDLNRTKLARQNALQAAGFATAAAGGIIAMAGSSSHSRGMEAAGWIAMGVGLATMIASELAIDPSADIRSWSFLPDRIYLALGRAPPATYEVEVRAQDAAGGDLSQKWTDVPVSEGPTLLWFRLLPGRTGGVYPADGRGRSPEAGEAGRSTETNGGNKSGKES